MEELKITLITTNTLVINYEQFATLLKKKCDEIQIEDAYIRDLWNKTRMDEDFRFESLPMGDDADIDFRYNELRYERGEEWDLEDISPLDDLVDDIMVDLRDYYETEQQWNDVYYEGPFGGFCGEHPHLQDFKVGTFHQTYGGGPEGGYLTMPDGSVYETKRTWGTPFEVPKKMEGKKLLRKKIRGNWKCRLVDASV